MQPRKTNQDIADESGLSVNAVGQFLRGETKSPSVDTAGPICAALGVSMDDHFGVEAPAEDDTSEVERLRLQRRTIHQRSNACGSSWRMQSA